MSIVLWVLGSLAVFILLEAFIHKTYHTKRTLAFTAHCLLLFLCADLIVVERGLLLTLLGWALIIVANVLFLRLEKVI